MKNTLFIFFIFFTIILNGQTYSVRGVVIDSITGEAELSATVSVFKQNNDKPVKQLTTDNRGIFEFELKDKGEYRMTVSSLGRNTLNINFLISGKENKVDIGNLYLTEDAYELREVAVVAKRPVISAEAGKISYSVTDDPDAQTNTILDILRKVPGVSITGEDEILVNGKSDFRIFVNGKPSNLFSSEPGKILKSIPANSIKNIEVIGEPGAKYDAEGVGGILNLVMNNANKLDGLMANVSGMVNTNGLNAGIYSALKKGKFTATLNYVYYNGKNPESTSKTLQEKFDDPYRKYLSTEQKTQNDASMHYATFEASYEIDSLNLLTFSGNLHNYDPKADFDGFNKMTDEQGAEVYSYRQKGKYHVPMNSQSITLDYQHTDRINKGKQYTLSYRYARAPRKLKSSFHLFDLSGTDPYLESMYVYQDTDNKSHADEHTVQADYTHPFSQKHKLEAGVKMIYRDNESESEYKVRDNETEEWRPDPSRGTDAYNQDQQIIAAYAAYGFNYKMISLSAGMRGEYTHQKVDFHMAGADRVKSDYMDAIPSLSFMWKPSMYKNLQLNYGMRISRPGIGYLNPFREVINPAQVRYGNPDLKPEKTHSVALSFGDFRQSFRLNASLRYSFTNNSIQNYQFVDDEGILHTTYGNIGKMKSIMLTAYFNWDPTSNTRIFFNGNMGYEKYQSDEKNNSVLDGVENDGMTGNFYVGVQQSFKYKFMLSGYGGYYFPSISLQGTGMANYYYTLSLSKSFFKERLSTSFSAYNFLEKYRTWTSKVSTSYFSTNNSYRMKIPTFGINISYRIGSFSGMVKKASRGINNDDIKDAKNEGNTNSGMGK